MKTALIPDAHVMTCANLFLVRPLTNRAFAWLEENTSGTWYANVLVVKPRYLVDLVAGMCESGLSVRIP